LPVPKILVAWRRWPRRTNKRPVPAVTGSLGSTRVRKTLARSPNSNLGSVAVPLLKKIRMYPRMSEVTISGRPSLFMSATLTERGIELSAIVPEVVRIGRGPRRPAR